MAIGAGVVTKFVTALLEGGTIDDILSKKLEDLGEDFLRKQLGGALGRSLERFEGTGEYDFAQVRDKWLHSAIRLPAGQQTFLNKLFRVIDQATSQRKRLHSGRWSKWERTDWARSRDDWLDNKWKHDWRSQPRNVTTGQWMPGRLDYIDPSMRYRGSKAGRRTKRRRKLRRQARTRGRKAARKLFAKLRRK